MRDNLSNPTPAAMLSQFISGTRDDDAEWAARMNGKPPAPDAPLAADALVWRTMESAPRDQRTSILLLLNTSEVVSAWFYPGDIGSTEPDADGAMWVCCDDRFQIEVEWFGQSYHDGEATHWMPMPPLPPEVADAARNNET